MAPTPHKSFAPLYLFLLLFAALIVFLYFQSRKEKHAPKTSCDQISFVGEKKKNRPDWEKQKDLTKLVERDGKLVQQLLDGTRITYTLDPFLQTWVKSELQKNEIPYGAAVVLDLTTKQVRLLAGYSHKHPKLTAGELTLKPWAPAASVIKVVTAAALLEGGKIDPQEAVCYSGGKRGLRPSHFTPDPLKDRNCETLFGAMGNSTNVIFARLAQQHLTKEAYLKMANLFGFNRTLPLGLPLSRSTLSIGSGERDLGYTAAGFGKATLSPYHAAWLMSLVALKGEEVRFMTVASVVDPTGKQLPLPTPHEPGERPRSITRETAYTLTRMLRKTVAEGTAREAFFSKQDEEYLAFKVVGKTGTLSRTNPEYLQYTWFAGFAPMEHPVMAFAVLIVNPAKWRTKATFFSQRLLLRYFKRLKRR